MASHWENSTLNPNKRDDAYTDPMLEHNGVDTRYRGYAGDIWFTEAMKYMAECRQKNQPFFVYLADNLAHVPDAVPDKYSKPYSDIGTWKGREFKVPAKYYGMIANIDENMGRLEEFLVNSGLKENTILLFLSDNGTRSIRPPKSTTVACAGIKPRCGRAVIACRASSAGRNPGSSMAGIFPN